MYVSKLGRKACSVCCVTAPVPPTSAESWKHCAGDCAALQVVCQGQATVVFLDQAYKPIRVPATVKEALMQLHQEYKAGLVQG